MVAIIINVPIQQVIAEAESQNVQKKSAQPDHPYRPITFPNSEEDKDLVVDRFSASFAMPPPPPPSPSLPPKTNLNSIAQNHNDQRFPVSSPSVELQRPTRVAIAATSSSERIPSQFTDEQLDYVRDFSWNMFQVYNKSIAISDDDT